MMGDGKGIERIEIRLEDPISSGTSRGRPHPGAAAAASTNSPSNILGERHPNRTAVPGTSHKPSKHGRVASSLFQTSVPVDEDELELERNRRDDGTGGGVKSYGHENGKTRRPEIKLVFQGMHVFAGIRQLVEVGLIDGEAMPSWMTGQEGVSIGVVRDGRILKSSIPDPVTKGRPSSGSGISFPPHLSPQVSNVAGAA